MLHQAAPASLAEPADCSSAQTQQAKVHLAANKNEMIKESVDHI